MAVQSKDMRNGKAVENALLQEMLDALPEAQAVAAPPNIGPKIASVLVWFGAVYTTYLLLHSLQPDTPWYILALVAGGVQYVLTQAERPLIAGRAGKLTYLVFLLDAAINAGGIYPQLANIGNSPTAQMFAAAGTPADVGAQATVLLALVLGGIIAVTPEALWRMK